MEENYAYRILEDSYNAHRDWYNQLHEAHAFIIANGEEPTKEDVALLQEVDRKVKQLREAMIKVLS